MSNKWKVFWVASFALALLFQACAHSWQEVFVSTAHEKQMGREFDSLINIKDKSVMSSGESVFVPKGDAQEAFYDYYQDRANEIVGAISENDWKGLLPSGYTKKNFFSFKIINSKTVNAFAVPGGYVYFYTAILKQFKSESELMGVLGHEVGHVVLHHSRDRIVKQMGASAVIDALMGGSMGATLANLGASFWLLKNSRENEMESDSMGFYYTNKIGISSAGLGDFFSKGLKDPEGKDCKEDSSVLDVISTHPPSCERVKKNRERMEKAKQDFPKDVHSVGGKNFAELVKAANL